MVPTRHAQLWARPWAFSRQRSRISYTTLPRRLQHQQQFPVHGADRLHRRAEPPRCQVCLKVGHTTNICWYRFDEDFIPESRVAAMASSSNGANPNWYLDSGATDHITGELEKLTMHERYHGTDQIRAANEACMDIVHVGKSVLPTITRPLHLNHVLHVPNTHKQLISIHRFNLDNNTFIELHPFFFLIEDQVTRKVLLRGPCRGGLYPLPQLSFPTQKLILSAIKPSSERWHCRLGHPALDIVLHVIRDNNLSCSGFASSESVCDACLRAKAHQLPYPRSFSQSTAPLELIFSDVWGPAIDSFGNKKFYVSFIDDFSKFIWIYLLRRKSEVFQFFQEFQSLVERMFHQKILGAVSMRDLTHSSAQLGFPTIYPALMLTSKTVLPSVSMRVHVCYTGHYFGC
jgi:hypothetical protein